VSCEKCFDVLSRLGAAHEWQTGGRTYGRRVWQ